MTILSIISSRGAGATGAGVEAGVEGWAGASGTWALNTSGASQSPVMTSERGSRIKMVCRKRGRKRKGDAITLGL